MYQQTLSILPRIEEMASRSSSSKKLDSNEPAALDSPRSISELNAAVVKLQKVYKSYRTRRDLADCADVVEELWWKALDFAAQKRRSEALRHISSQDLSSEKPAKSDHSKYGGVDTATTS